MNDHTTLNIPVNEALLSDLLLKWEEQQESGGEISIADLCGPDIALQQVLARRIAILAEMDQLLLSEDSTLQPDDTKQHQSARDKPPQPPPGYELFEQLGRGGMGVVYKARQINLDRIVALKMIHGGALAPQILRKRFQAEAESVARLQHPNIVQIHDVGEHNGLPFCALEYVAGGTLAEKLSGKPLPPNDAAQMVQQLSLAVQAAHDKAIVHRDLKPGNILLTESEVLKITDFGLAKCLDSDDSSTRTGDVLGTPSYMAPEQASGGVHEIGAAADVYALGAILYEAITGRPPFRAASPIDTVMQVINNDPVAPSKLQPSLPRDLETICLKCLLKKPSQRYASADALAKDLERFIQGRPILARPIGLFERSIKYARRHPSAAAIIGLVLFGLITGLATVGVYNSRLQAEQTKLRTANDQLTSKGAELHQAKELAEAQRETAVAALREKNRLQSLSFVAYGRACALAAKIANLDDSVVNSASRSKQISDQALVQFQLQYDLLQQAGDPSMHPALNAYWNALQNDSRKQSNDNLKRLSLDLAQACGAAWRQETAEMPELQRSIRAHLYKRVCAATDRLAASPDISKVSHSYDEFWELYWGELAIVESTAVQSVMVNFGELLKQKKQASTPEHQAKIQTQLSNAAKDLRIACGLDR